VSGRALVCALVVLAWPCVLLGQTCTITSPAAASYIQTPQAMQFAATVSAAPTAYKLIYSVDYQRWATGYVQPDPGKPNDYRDTYQGAFIVNWYPGLNGDGPRTVTGTVYDIFGNILATCPAVSFTVRIEGMSNQSINSLPTSGTGVFGFKTFDTTEGGAQGLSFAVDGQQVPSGCGGSLGGQSGGFEAPSFITTCFTNGAHQVFGSYYLGNIPGEPYLLTSTVTSAGSGTTLTASAAPYVVQGSIVTFSTSGTLPAPLVAGTQCYWQAGTGSCTASVSISGGTMTFTCSPGCGLSTSGTPVFVRNIQSTNQVTGMPNCDGYYTNTTYISSTSFSIPAISTCPNSVTGAQNLEVDVNPYFAIYSGSGNTFSVSATATTPTIAQQYGTWTPGTAVTFTSAGSGTQTALQRIRSPYWTGYSSAGGLSGGDLVKQGGQAYINTQVTFSNGSAPMELEPNCWEFHTWPGKTSDTSCFTGGSDTLVLRVKNTDLSYSSLTCTSAGVTCTYSDDGYVTGQLSLNTSTGAITPNATSSWSVPSAPRAWGKITISCTACATGGVSLQPLTVYIENSASANNNPHFTTCGPIATSFQTGSCHSFFPSGLLQLDVTYGTAYRGTSEQPWLAPMIQAAGLNSATVGLTPGFGPATTPQSTCTLNPPSTTSNVGYAESFASSNGISLEFDMSNIWATGNSGTALGTGLAAVLGNVQYNRQACVTAFIMHQVAAALYWREYSDDEEPSDLGLGTILMPNPLIGGSNCTLQFCWQSATVSGTGITFNLVNPPSINSGNWVQSTGYGTWIQVVDATNTCLNGWYPILTNSSTAWTSNNNGSCANGTYEPSGGTTETTAQLVINPVGANQNCGPIPASVVDSQQGWTGSYTGECAGTSALGNLQTATGTASASSTTLTMSSFNNMTVVAGEAVFATNIPTGTTVSNISGSTITLSQQTTGAVTTSNPISFSGLSSIVCSSGTCTVNWTAHGIPAGTAVRISGATTANLNILAVVNASPGTNSFTLTYAGTSGEAAPANGTYTSATDPNLFISVDPNYAVNGGPNPLGVLNGLIGGVSGHPARVYPILGLNFATNQLPTVYSYQGDSTKTDSSFVYNQGNPPLIYGTDLSVFGAAYYATATAGGANNGGIVTRPWQLKPRSIYWGDGFIDAGNIVQYCRSFNFNPACDRPAQLGWRPEETIAQLMGMKDISIVGFRGYNFTQNMSTYYSIFCCGWQTRGSGNGNGMNPWNNPKQWAAMARVNAYAHAE
jgi:hypothetical protein